MAKQIPEDLARSIRERYEDLKELDAGLDREERQTSTQRDAQVAKDFGLSLTAVKDIVMGVTHTEAGGPIDHARRQRRELYARERISLGDTEARRRLQLRARNIDPAPKAERLVQRVTILDSKGQIVAQTEMEPGQTLQVALVAVGGDR